MKFRVLRRHLGDKLYEAGDEREAHESDVAHLVRAGVLIAATKAGPEPKRKAEPAPTNKAEPTPAKNKAD